jgi:hypothetical protein
MSGYGKRGPSKKEDRFCRVEGCEKPVDAHGLCSTHYRRWQMTGSAQADKPVRHWGSYPGDESASIDPQRQKLSQKL